MTKITYNIPSISCNHCARAIELEINEVPGVEEVKADTETKTARNLGSLIKQTTAQ